MEDAARLQAAVLQTIHTAHPGLAELVDKMKSPVLSKVGRALLASLKAQQGPAANGTLGPGSLWCPAGKLCAAAQV